MTAVPQALELLGLLPAVKNPPGVVAQALERVLRHRRPKFAPQGVNERLFVVSKTGKLDAHGAGARPLLAAGARLVSRRLRRADLSSRARLAGGGSRPPCPHGGADP